MGILRKGGVSIASEFVARRGSCGVFSHQVFCRRARLDEEGLWCIGVCVCVCACVCVCVRA